MVQNVIATIGSVPVFLLQEDKDKVHKTLQSNVDIHLF